MKIFISSQSIELSPKEMTSLESKLTTLLGHLSRSVVRVNAFFHDSNGSRGGVDKVCRLMVELRRQPAIVIEGRGENIAALIATSLDRLDHTVSRRLKRRRDRQGSVSMSGE
jgi:putative sigma-54 modulation protein